MGTVEIIEEVSLTDMSDQIPKKFGATWEMGHERTQILVLIQRRHRQRFEEYASTIQLQHPTWSLFYRPRQERDDITASGLNPADASFLFLDIALVDLGRWVGPLAKDDWERAEIVIQPSDDGDSFSPMKWTCFRDPWLAEIEVLPLATAPHSIVSKAWLTTPSSAPQAPQPASGQGDEFAGMLAGVSHSFGSQPATQPAPPMPAPIPAPAPAPEPKFELPSAPVAIPNFGPASTPPEPASAPTPSSLSPTPTAAVEVTAPAPVPEPEPTPEPIKAPTPPPLEVVEEPDSEESLKKELLDTIHLLKTGGVAAEDILEHPTFVEVSERATLSGIDVWSIFVGAAN